MSDALTLPENPVGCFIALREPMKPRNLLYIEPALYEVTGVQGKKRLLIKLVHGEQSRERGFTTIGENIACAVRSKEKGLYFLKLVEAAKAKFDVIEAESSNDFSRYPDEQAPTVRARTRTRSA